MKGCAFNGCATFRELPTCRWHSVQRSLRDTLIRSMLPASFFCCWVALLGLCGWSPQRTAYLISCFVLAAALCQLSVKKECRTVRTFLSPPPFSLFRLRSS